MRLDKVVPAVNDLQRAEARDTRLLGAGVGRRLQEPVLVQLRTGVDLLDLDPGAPDPPPSQNVALLRRIDPLDETAIRAHMDGLGIKVAASTERYGADGQ